MQDSNIERIWRNIDNEYQIDLMTIISWWWLMSVQASIQTSCWSLDKILKQWWKWRSCTKSLLRILNRKHMGVSENSVPHCTQWFCWSLSLWKMAISLGILTQHFQVQTHIDNSKFQGSHSFPRLLGQYEPSSIHHVRCRGLDPPTVDGILQYPGDA